MLFESQKQFSINSIFLIKFSSIKDKNDKSFSCKYMYKSILWFMPWNTQVLCCFFPLICVSIVIVSQNMDSMNTASTFEGCGTPLYISPEQKNKGHVDSKTDIYSLGIILFELFYPMTSEKRYEVCQYLSKKNESCPASYFFV